MLALHESGMLQYFSKFELQTTRKMLSLVGGISLFGLISQSASVLAEPSTSTTNTLPKSGNSIVGLFRAISDSIAQTTKTTATTQAETTLADRSDTPVTSVNQLSDVQPTDWAFQALQSLIERYGVIAGYPDGTYRGNRAMTRYEFASGLNAVLERVNELISTGLAERVSRDDLATLQRLQAEFTVELATLRGRVDTLEARTAELEANQFSTTTKLSGLVVAAVTFGGFSGDLIVDPRGVEITDNDPNATFIYRTSLNLNTSFSGTDSLLIRLESGSDRDRDNATGFLEPNFGSVVDFSYRSAIEGDLEMTRLNYTFTPFEDFKLTVGPTITAPDYIDKNSYANQGHLDFTTLALNNNYILFPVSNLGAGAFMDWKPGGGQFSVRALYVAADAANPDPDTPSPAGTAGVSPLVNLLYPEPSGNGGLFGDPYQGMVELEYAASNSFAIRLQYSGGNVFDGRFDVFGANFELAFSPQLGIFGRYGNGSYDNTSFGDLNPQYWSAGVSFRDLFKQGAIAGIAAGQPFIESEVGNATQTNFEAFYNLPIDNNIRITPAIQVITNPSNQDSNGTIFSGSVRASLSF